jgi:hypothetical protein
MAIQGRLRKKKEDTTKRRNILIFVGVVAVSMLLSGFYYITPSTRTPGRQGRGELPLNRYKVEQFGNFSVLVKIKNITSDLILIPAPRAITFEKISSLLNSSIPGVNYISCDSTDLYFLCTFNLGIENSTPLIKEELDKKFRSDYSLVRGFIGELPVNISGTDEVYIIGTKDNKPGEYVRAFLFQKKDTGGIIGFEEKKVPLGERIPSKVLNLTAYTFSGIIAGNFNFENFSEELELNSSEISFSSPHLIVNKTLNETLDNETFFTLRTLGSVSVEIDTKKNITTISFNNSLEGITKILKKNNLTYSFENGSIKFKTDINVSVDKVREVMKKFGILEIEVNKEAVVSFSNEVIFNERIVKIEKSNEFPASVDLDTEEGDEVNITLSIIQFGEQIIPFGAREVNEEKKLEKEKENGDY